MGRAGGGLVGGPFTANAAPPDAASDSARPETAKSRAWDAAFSQSCLQQATTGGQAPSAAQSYCRCPVAALQPLPLARKHRLGARSHEILAAEHQCGVG